MENKEWKEYRFYEIIDLIGGGTPKTSIKEYWNGSIPWLSVVDFNTGKKYVSDTEKKITELGLNNSSTKLLEKDDIIISARGTVGALAVLDKTMAFNQSCYGIRAKKEYSFNDYIFYLLKDTVNNLKQFAHGGVFDTITKDTFKEIEIQLPPFPEQKAIASVLSSLDDKIDLLYQQNQTLETLAETLFRQWFIEEAKEDWKEITLGSLIDIFGGYSYKGNKIGQGSSYLLGMGCVSYSDRFLYSGMRKYDEEVNNKYLVEKGDIVIATRQQSDNLPILGAPAIIPEIDKNYKVIVGTNLYKVVNNSNLNYYSLYRLLKTPEYKNFIKSNAKGSTVRMITKDAILSFPILLPPNNTVNKLNKELSSVNNKIELNNNQIQTLTHLRDTLLPKLMSCEVQVRL